MIVKNRVYVPREGATLERGTRGNCFLRSAINHIFVHLEINGVLCDSMNARREVPMHQIDATDYAILEILKGDGRCSYSDIAEQVSLSRVAVRERISNMKNAGIL